ncbi:MAG: hypothetical protein V7651_14375 [Hyphomonas oceanitis]|uniref:hypothetical protein n=1 Tax=Hyphomonas oceanitis TaxID=81033 RepID=UPI0030024963
MGWWEFIGQFNESQTAIVTTTMIIAGGAGGVVLGSLLFGGRVRDLQTALKSSIEAIEIHARETKDKLNEMNEQMASTMAALGQLRGAVSDIQSDAEVAEEQNAQPAEQDNAIRRTQLKENWYAIRNELWRRANDPSIHGKTRTRYARYGNNELGDLLDAMAQDGHLDARSRQLFLGALELWTWHRNGRPHLTEQNVQSMREFKIQLVHD